MKLRDYIKTIPDDAEIAIGIASGYVYLGTAAHFAEVEDRISTELLEELINSKANAQKDVLYICKHGITPRQIDLTKEEPDQALAGAKKAYEWIYQRTRDKELASKAFNSYLIGKGKRSDIEDELKGETE